MLLLLFLQPQKKHKKTPQETHTRMASMQQQTNGSISDTQTFPENYYLEFLHSRLDPWIKSNPGALTLCAQWSPASV